MYKVDNAVILAAGTSSRFAPLSYERPKALLSVRGEVLIERQIRQLRESGVREIAVVVGYKKEQFDYLRRKCAVRLIENAEYAQRNNHSSIFAARDCLRNSYICSADNYFSENPFEPEVEDAYYAALYADGPTEEWCMEEGEDGYVSRVRIGGANMWYMLGQVFWNEAFSRDFLRILEAEYARPETRGLLWEHIYMRHTDVLKLKLRRYERRSIFEFDSLDELRGFDESYRHDSRSPIIKRIAAELGCREADMADFTALKADAGAEAAGFCFRAAGQRYAYDYRSGILQKTAG